MRGGWSSKPQPSDRSVSFQHSVRVRAFKTQRTKDGRSQSARQAST